ncbi:MAG: hypothetical protein LBK82_02145 [Planctomycetaceae bacterium]|jgi:hypothetical protein|nr:hypothetical protein [Planctomycetaceae bacterium]
MGGCDFSQSSVTHLAPSGALGVGGVSPAVALRFTAGYAHHTPAGLRFKNKKSTDILPIILRFRWETPNPVESGKFY